jgi:hypothetical protein
MAKPESARVAFAILFASAAAVAAGCDRPPLPARSTTDPGVAPQSLAIPASVGAPILNCGGNVGAVRLQLPCLLGMAPVSEVDCGLEGAPTEQKIRFMLPLSLPNSSNGGAPVLGQPMPFEADVLPFGTANTLANQSFTLQSMKGTVELTQLSLSNATLDGWFPHLTFAWIDENATTVFCTLDNGRFTAIPGGFL